LPGFPVGQEEALAKLEECEKAGLVPQLSKSENPEALGLKLKPEPERQKPPERFEFMKPSGEFDRKVPA